MIRRGWLLLAAVACGGGGAGPPAGPAYTPVGSPEAESACPTEWEAAKKAREDHLELSSASTREAAARAVLAQADCERNVLASRRVAAGEHAAIIAALEELRAAHRDAGNLYREVIGYELASPAVAARVGLGKLHLAFAALLAATPTPTDMPDPGEQAAWRAEIDGLVATFQSEARAAFAEAAAANPAGAEPTIGD
jgi:hypothetical protein